MPKYILCDLPNTLFDSRHRTGSFGLLYHTGIKQDRLNYSCYLLLKELMNNGYEPIFTHYCLSRLTKDVLYLLELYHLPVTDVYTNFNNPEVLNNRTLKMQLFTVLENTNKSVTYVIDNSKDTETFWLNKQVSLIKVPLGID